jgi:CTD small phosphatase-like protein 2
MFSPALRTDPNGNLVSAAWTSTDTNDDDAPDESTVVGDAVSSVITPCASSDNTLAEPDTFDEGEEEEEEDEEDYEDVFNPYQFIAGLPAHGTVKVPNKIVLPPVPVDFPSNKLTLVLDLDETLVHCTVDPVENPDLIFPVS